MGRSEWTGNRTHECDDEAVHKVGECDGRTEEERQIWMGAEDEWYKNQCGWNHYAQDDISIR